jgi:asparagine synthase (glutamine-hydrolysing)
MGGAYEPAQLPLAVAATIYNAQDVALQIERRGRRRQDGTDQELVQMAFEVFGPECFAMFNGDFTIALWDERARRLILARDALGARVLYYWYGPRCVAFASEYKALLALGDLEAKPDLVALQHLQRAKYLPPGCTLLEGVRPVSAAHWVEANGEHVVEHRYWDPIINPQSISMAAAEQRLRELFLQAVSKRVGGGSRIGAELSSGIDSAAVVAAMRRARPDESIKTFTIGAGPDDPEILGARRVAEHLQTDHREIFAGPECLSEVMPAVIWHLEDPIARTETVLYYQMMKVASEHIDVVLGGYASDGLYAGMPKHKLVKMMQIAPMGRKAIEEFYHYTQVSEPPHSVLGSIVKRLYFGGDELLAPAILGAPPAVAPSPLPKRRQGLLNEVLRDGIRYGVPGWLPKVEKTHAAHGVELRSPFTDLDLVRFSFELPEHFKLRGLKDKFLLRRALIPLLPREVVNRPKFPQAMDYSLKLSDVLDALADQLLSPPDLRQRGFFDPATLEVLRRRAPGQPYGFNRAMRLWTVIATELWARLFLDQRAACSITGSIDQIPAPVESLGVRAQMHP